MTPKLLAVKYDMRWTGRLKRSNPSGTQAAACTDWRAMSRFHVGTGHTEPTQDAG